MCENIFFDYFVMFHLEREDSRKINCHKLQAILGTINNRHGQEAQTNQMVLNQAISIFNDEDKYQNYLKKLDTQSPSTSSKREQELAAELERERRKKQAELEMAQRERDRLQRERHRAQEEAEERRLQHEAELEEAQRRIKEAKQREPEMQEKVDTSPKNGWQLLGEVTKYALNPQARTNGWQLVSDVARYMNDKYTQQQQPTPSSISGNAYDNSFDKSIVNLNGIWRDTDGFVYTIVQCGNQLTIQHKKLLLTIAQGRGIVSGRQVQISYQHVDGSSGEAYLEVSVDGTRLQGESINFVSGARWSTILFRS